MSELSLERLARACHLEAERQPDGAWRVSGGERTQLVDAAVRECSCTDFGVRGGACKHILAVRLRLGDPETLEALRLLVPPPRRARRR
jgi:SWIM zinc finger